MGPSIISGNQWLEVGAADKGQLTYFRVLLHHSKEREKEMSEGLRVFQGATHFNFN